jgi:hypothetical protein
VKRLALVIAITVGSLVLEASPGAALQCDVWRWPVKTYAKHIRHNRTLFEMKKSERPNARRPRAEAAEHDRAQLLDRLSSAYSTRRVYSRPLEKEAS